LLFKDPEEFAYLKSIEIIFLNGPKKTKRDAAKALFSVPYVFISYAEKIVNAAWRVSVSYCVSEETYCAF